MAIGLIGFVVSCEKALEDPKLDMGQTIPAGISNPVSGTDFVLTEAEAENEMTTFQWSATQYNLNNLESSNYVLQLDVQGNNFASAFALATTTETTFSITVGAMNSRMRSLEFGPDTMHTMEFRVRSFINDLSEYTESVSDVIVLNITPYETVAPPPVTDASLWIPGDYQGWDPAGAPQIFSYTDDGVFKGYMFMPEGGTYEFKFTSAPDWDHTNFGNGGDGILDPDAGAGNLVLPGPGGYSVVVDTVGLTWTHVLESWGVIGEWLGWAEDIDMEWDAENELLTLTIDVPDADDNRFKFRANDGWDVNLGAKDPDDGTLIPGGADIPFPAPGNYTFILDFNTEEPTYQLIQN